MDKKKKILFILTALNGGGAERVLINILRYFDYQRYEVDLCLLFNEGVFLKDVDKRVRLFTLYSTTKSKQYWWHRKIYKYIGSNFFLRKKIRNVITQHYDTIVSFAEGTSLQFHQFILDRADRHVTWVHIDLQANHWTNYLFKEGEERKIYQQMDEIVFVSKDAQMQFNRLFEVLHVKQRVIYNLIDSQLIREEASEFIPHKRKFTIVAVGRLTKQKRFDRLINVCAMLKKDNYDVDTWIIGDGQLRPNLEQQIQRLGLEENVFLLGFKNPPYSYMKQADLFVSTSETEGYPLVVCEALVLGLPIIATHITGPKELLDEGKYGVLVEKDEFSIYNGIISVIESDEQRKYYTQKSLERSRCFDIDYSMVEIYNVL